MESFRMSPFKLYCSENESKLAVMFPFLNGRQILSKLKSSWRNLPHYKKKMYQRKKGQGKLLAAKRTKVNGKYTTVQLDRESSDFDSMSEWLEKPNPIKQIKTYPAKKQCTYFEQEGSLLSSYQVTTSSRACQETADKATKAHFKKFLRNQEICTVLNVTDQHCDSKELGKESEQCWNTNSDVETELKAMSSFFAKIEDKDLNCDRGQETISSSNNLSHQDSCDTRVDKLYRYSQSCPLEGRTVSEGCGRGLPPKDDLSDKEDNSQQKVVCSLFSSIKKVCFVENDVEQEKSRRLLTSKEQEGLTNFRAMFEKTEGIFV